MKTIGIALDNAKEKDEAIRRRGFIYANGEMNRLYKAYILGYAHGRCNYLNGRWVE